MTDIDEFTKIRSELFKKLKENKNNLQESSSSLLDKLSSFVSKGNPYKDEAEALIDLLFREIELERDNWKRLRSAIEHENTLTNHRITWLVSSQSFLFAAFILAVNQWAKKNEIYDEALYVYPLVMCVIATAGVITCWLTYQSLCHGDQQLKFLDQWWHIGKDWNSCTDTDVIGIKGKNGRQAVSMSHPPLQGSSKSRIDKYLGTDKMPIYFLIIWVAILFFIVLKPFFPVFICPKKFIYLALLSVDLSILLMVFLSYLLKGRKKC